MNSYETRKTLEKELRKCQNGCKKITAISKNFISCLDNETKTMLRNDILKILFDFQGQMNKQEQTEILKSLYRLGVRKTGKYKLLSTGMFRTLEAV